MAPVVAEHPLLFHQWRFRRQPTFFFITRAQKNLFLQYSLLGLEFSTPTKQKHKRNSSDFRLSYRLISSESYYDENDEDDGAEDCTFDEAVSLFNGREYYKCHDFLESLWNNAEEPRRTLFHGVLQCAVGLHHLFNQNHRGAMLELGEGLCKLRKMNFKTGPFHQFEQDISAALEFVYQTQLEQAACTDNFCLTMDGSERSYQLLGSFAAGQHLYHLETEPDGILYIMFCRNGSSSADKPPRVKVPTLHATEEHVMACDYI